MLVLTAITASNFKIKDFWRTHRRSHTAFLPNEFWFFLISIFLLDSQLEYSFLSYFCVHFVHASVKSVFHCFSKKFAEFSPKMYCDISDKSIPLGRGVRRYLFVFGVSWCWIRTGFLGYKSLSHCLIRYLQAQCISIVCLEDPYDKSCCRKETCFWSQTYSSEAYTLCTWKACYIRFVIQNWWSLQLGTLINDLE